MAGAVGFEPTPDDFGGRNAKPLHHTPIIYYLILKWYGGWDSNPHF